MSHWLNSVVVWHGIAVVCGLATLSSTIIGFIRRLIAPQESSYKVRLKIGSRTLLFDPNVSPERLEAQLAEALEGPDEDGPASR